ncbi:glycosyltransferase family 4 protein [Acidocella sp.]|uniref:glycosyltransferase family 4 protein n=1 Tax=Acidocella sp. TaxID=50710 RepID=UPI0026064E3C|nr:glycosyltransferase family 4 protein [Acidocella sp.]
MPDSRPLLVFLIMEDWFFLSHFQARARAAQAAGWRVAVIARQSEAAADIRAAGFEFYAAALDRKRLNPFRELALSLWLARLYRRLRPDVVHHIALKPIILGGVAARLAGGPAVLNAPIGLGFVFSSRKLLARALRPFVSLGLRATMNPRRGLAVFENPDDLNAMVGAGMVRRERARLVRGAGVDLRQFQPAPEPEGTVRVLLAARLIREKGIGVYAAAARQLRGRAEFWLAGAPDASNPNPVTEAELRQWEGEGILHWLGPVRDMAGLLRQVHVFTLPSTYREGLPKVILEAMAAGRPVVATDIPGCREAVAAEETGYLVPPGDASALAAALARLIIDPALRRRLGMAGRARVERYFSDENVCAETLRLYEALRAGTPFTAPATTPPDPDPPASAWPG